jgi:chlorobactene glucosyltransferase
VSRKRGARLGRASFFVGFLAAVAWVAVAAIALVDRRTIRVLQAARAPDDESVTIIVPARNEERNIGPWIMAARQQQVRHLKVIVVDDESHDATGAVALEAAHEDPRVEIIAVSPRPAGWIGKPWAAYLGALKAQSNWLLFSDADMRMDPQALPSALAAARILNADALSLTTTLECEDFWERCIMPEVALLIFTAMPVWATQEAALPTALLAGGFLLVRTSAYWLVGGHASVRGSIAEDRDLAQRLKAFGFRIRMLDGSRMIRVRMYRGFADMWRGWRKNFYEGVRRNPLFAAFAIAASIAMFVLPIPTLAGLLVRRVDGTLTGLERKLAVASATSIGAMLVARLARDPSVGIKTTAASILLSPIAGVFIAAVMAASAWRVISGRGQQWKGRTIA